MIDLRANCLAQWHLNETSGTDVLDATANNVDGVASADISNLTVDGKLNNAFNLASTYYVDFGDVLSFEYTDQFSISCWIKTTASNRVIIAKRTSGSEAKGWAFEIVSGTPRLRISNSLIGNLYIDVRVTAENTVNDDSYYHVVATYDGSGLASGVSIYIDDVSQALGTSRDTLGGNTIQHNDPLILGRGHAGTIWADDIDEVAIFNKVLSDEEVAFLYNREIGTESLISIPSGFKFMFCTDLQHRASDAYSIGLWNTNGEDGEWRVNRTGLNRLQACLNDCVTQEVDLLVLGGDLIEGFSSKAIDGGRTVRQTLGDVIDKIEVHAYTGQVMFTMGNHEDMVFNVDDLLPKWEEYRDAYYADIDACTKQVTRANVLTVDGQDYGYTYEQDGFKFLIVETTRDEGVKSNQLTWLDNQLDTALPCIILNHIATRLFSQDYQNVLINNPSAQIILLGHDHRGIPGALQQDVQWYGPANDDQGYSDYVGTFAQNIFLFTGRGGCRPTDTVAMSYEYDETDAIAANNDPDNKVARDAAHYLMEVKAFAVGGGAERITPNVKINGLYQASDGTIDFTKYLGA